MPDIPQRTRQSFPTRQYRYEFVLPRDVQMDEPLVRAGVVYRFILGRDDVPAPIEQAEGQRLLRDPFARLVLFGEAPPPLSLRALLARLDAAGITGHRTFVVADGGQVSWSAATDDLERGFRLAIARQAPGEADPDILISASTDIDSPTNFLQVIGWDDEARANQFYERRGGVWMWAGSGWDAFQPESRGKGPFDSHVNGALNMKELKFPWVHWHSPSATISDEVLAPADPLRNEPLWRQRSLADDFERTVVRPGIQRWTGSRFARLTRDGRLTRLPDFFEQVLGTSTINLVSSPISSAAMEGGEDVLLPVTFLLDADTLLGAIGLDAIVSSPVVPAAIYKAVLHRFDVRLEQGSHRFDGDTHFVFVVPEPAFEDVLVTETLLARGVLSTRLLAAMLMVDFQNPVFSRRRGDLRRYIPADTPIGAPETFASTFVRAIEASPAAGTPGTGEHEFLANFALPETVWRAEYVRRIDALTRAVTSACATLDGFAAIFELAESRRREFRARKLAEFRLTTPVTNIPETSPLLELDPGGNVRPK
jgi:hypothetical protein